MGTIGRITFRPGQRTGQLDLNDIADQIVNSFETTADRDAAYSGLPPENGEFAFVRSELRLYAWSVTAGVFGSGGWVDILENAGAAVPPPVDGEIGQVLGIIENPNQLSSNRIIARWVDSFELPEIADGTESYVLTVIDEDTGEVGWREVPTATDVAALKQSDDYLVERTADLTVLAVGTWADHGLPQTALYTVNPSTQNIGWRLLRHFEEGRAFDPNNLPAFDPSTDPAIADVAWSSNNVQIRANSQVVLARILNSDIGTISLSRYRVITRSAGGDVFSTAPINLAKRLGADDTYTYFYAYHAFALENNTVRGQLRSASGDLTQYEGRIGSRGVEQVKQEVVDTGLPKSELDRLRDVDIVLSPDYVEAAVAEQQADTINNIAQRLLGTYSLSFYDAADVAGSYTVTVRVAGQDIHSFTYAGGSESFSIDTTTANSLAANIVGSGLPITLPMLIRFTATTNPSAVFYSKVLGFTVGRDHATESQLVELPDGSVTTPKIRDDAVTEEKMAPDSVGTEQIKDGAVTHEKLAEGSVEEDNIVDNIITTNKIADDAIHTRHIADGQITQDAMRQDSVGTMEIINDSVTELKLSSAVRSKLNQSGGGGTGSGGTGTDTQARADIATIQEEIIAELIPGGVPSGLNAEGTYNLRVWTKEDSWTGAVLIVVRLAGSQVVRTGFDPSETHRMLQFEISNQLASNLNSNNRLDEGDVLLLEIEIQSTGAVIEGTLNMNVPVVAPPSTPPAPTSGLNQSQVDARIRAGVKDFAEAGNSALVDTNDIEDNAIIARKLDASSVVSTKIADAAVTTNKIENNAVTTAKIAADTITRGEMAAGSVGNTELVDNAVVNRTINDGAVSEDKLASAVRSKLAAIAENASEILTEEATRRDADTALGVRINNIRQLPPFPAEGSRDNKVPKFNGDNLDWEEDAVGTGGGGGTIADNSITPAKAEASTAIQKRAWRNRLDAAKAPSVHLTTFDYTVTAANIGGVIRVSGTGNRRISLPNIDGTSVPVGSWVHIVNDHSSGTCRIDGDTTDTINGAQIFYLPPGRAVGIQAISTAQWLTVDDAGYGVPAAWNTLFANMPIEAGTIVTHNGNFYGALTDHNRGGTGPNADTTNWINLSASGGTLADGSITTAKLADDAVTGDKIAAGAIDRPMMQPDFLAELEVDIEIGPEFYPNERTQKNLYVSINKPNGTFTRYRQLRVSVQGTTPVVQAFDPRQDQRTYTVGITEALMGDIADSNHFTEGNYILVDLRIQAGSTFSPGDYFKNFYIPVVARPEDTTARTSARTNANAISAIRQVPPTPDTVPVGGLTLGIDGGSTTPSWHNRATGGTPSGGGGGGVTAFRTAITTLPSRTLTWGDNVAADSWSDNRVPTGTTHLEVALGVNHDNRTRVWYSGMLPFDLFSRWTAVPTRASADGMTIWNLDSFNARNTKNPGTDILIGMYYVASTRTLRWTVFSGGPGTSRDNMAGSAVAATDRFFAWFVGAA